MAEKHGVHPYTLNEVFDINSLWVILTLLHSEWPKLYRVLAILNAIGLIRSTNLDLWMTNKLPDSYRQILIPRVLDFILSICYVFPRVLDFILSIYCVCIKKYFNYKPEYQNTPKQELWKSKTSNNLILIDDRLW